MPISSEMGMKKAGEATDVQHAMGPQPFFTASLSSARCNGAVGTDGFQTHLFEDVRDRGRQSLRWKTGERSIMLKGHAQTLGGGTDQLTDAGNLEGCLLDFFGAGVRRIRRRVDLLQGAVYHAGAGGTHGRWWCLPPARQVVRQP